MRAHACALSADRRCCPSAPHRRPRGPDGAAARGGGCNGCSNHYHSCYQARTHTRMLNHCVRAQPLTQKQMSEQLIF